MLKSYQDLIVWQKGHQLVLGIYKVTEKFPSKEMFGLTNQMRRASVSVTSNIAEAFGRFGWQEKIQFYFLANGSLLELHNQLQIATDLGYINRNIFNQINLLIDEVKKMLASLVVVTKVNKKKYAK